MIPKLRFPEFVYEWKATTVDGAFAVNTNKSNLPSEFYYIDLESVKNGRLSEVSLINLTEAPSRAQRLLEKQCILFQMVRPYQKNNLLFNDKLLNGVAVASTGYSVLKPIDGSINYYFTLLQNDRFVNRVLIRSTGSNYPAINSSELKRVRLYDSQSITEKAKLGNLFSVLDQKINLLTKKKEALETYKKGLMQKIFSQELRFKREDETDYPEWQHYIMGQLFENISTNSLSRALLYENGDVLNLHYGDIHLKYSGLLDISKAELPFALKTDYKFKESSKMETGDVIFADAAEDYEGIGKAVEIRQTGATHSYAGLHTIHLKSKTEVLASGYMGYLSQTYAFRRKVWFIAQGAKVLGISSKELLKLSVVVPKKEEQDKIVAVFSNLDAYLKKVSNSIQSTELLKQGLLQQMFV